MLTGPLWRTFWHSALTFRLCDTASVGPAGLLQALVWCMVFRVTLWETLVTLMWHKRFMLAGMLFLWTTICKSLQNKYLPVIRRILQIAVMTCCQSSPKWVSLFCRFISSSSSSRTVCCRSNLFIQPLCSSAFRTKLIKNKDVYTQMLNTQSIKHSIIISAVLIYCYNCKKTLN